MRVNNKIINGFIIIGIICLIISLILMLRNNDRVDNHIKEINFIECQEIIKKEDYNVILLTSPTCSHCRSYKKYVNYVCDSYNMEVYNLNIDELGYEEYLLVHDKYNATKDKYIEDKPSILTPTTVIIKNNVEVESISGNLGYNGFLELLEKYEIIKSDSN